MLLKTYKSNSNCKNEIMNNNMDTERAVTWFQLLSIKGAK